MTVINFDKKNNFSKTIKLGYKNPIIKIKNNNKNFIFFSKFELTSILNLYSKQVSQGFWKDYALDSHENIAVFSIYRHSHDKPIYQIIKINTKETKNKPNFFIKKDSQIINKSNQISIILSRFEKKLSIKKYL